ncbi:MAG: alpha/beta hydrolase fold domain-containing protein [Anaerolineae bacterium]|nr:alpha/beta hydrolase fold domain-containing protein [Anaerolineae bacterium]
MKKRMIIITVILLFVLGVAACTQAADVPEETTIAESTPATPADSTTTPVEEPADEATLAEPEATAVPTPLPPYPLNITFTADDGTELIGHYWAPASQNAPVIVLMHQYTFDHNIQWVALAPWLQNRGLTAAVRTGGEPFTDPSWFTPIIEGLDFAIFSFTFRNCEGGCQEDSVASREEWVIDAVSAIKAAASFTNVNPQEIIVIGTSIGADAAVDACDRLADDESLRCAGIVSISPASWLDVDYTATVESLNEAGVEVRCIASENDGITAETCRSFEGEHHQSFIDSGNAHGVRMFNPAGDFDLTALIVQWLIEWTVVPQ